MSHVTYEWVMSHMNESCHIRMSHVTYEWVMSHLNESCHIWTSQLTYEQSCHIWTSHVTHEWVMSHTNESCHIWTSLWPIRIPSFLCLSHTCHYSPYRCRTHKSTSSTVICVSRVTSESVHGAHKKIKKSLLLTALRAGTHDFFFLGHCAGT